jgi:hypothetical protein
MNDDLDFIRNIALAVRHEMILLPEELRLWPSRQFPTGACDEASHLLGAILAKRGQSGFSLVVCRGDYGVHVWLQRQELSVDITADQFPDAPDDVIVALNSDWHTRRFRCRPARLFKSSEEGPYSTYWEFFGNASGRHQMFNHVNPRIPH